MALRRVLQATEPRGEAFLRRKSRKVKSFDSALRGLVNDMIETMHTYNGVGLAAPQVGELLRVVVAQLPPEEDQEDEGGEPRPGLRVVLCNPEITWCSEEEEIGQEGCLSLANWYGDVSRAGAVEIRYRDLRGKRRSIRAEGYLARILQHEIDHLEGVLFTDQVEDLSTLVRFTEEGPVAIQVEDVPVSV